jgi:GNAT superfamily N-acetyltransferase
MEVRPARPDDEAAWRELWKGYCDFYETEVPEHVTAATWRRLLDADSAMSCLVADDGGEVAGFTNYILHPSTWAEGDYCYLEDLFVRPDARAGGTGRALIQAVLARASELGCEHVYWHTREDNARARALYDSFNQADGFVRYVVAAD